MHRYSVREVGLLSDLFVGSANAQADIDSVSFLLERLMTERAAHDPDLCKDCIMRDAKQKASKPEPEPYPCAGCGRDVDDPEAFYCAACVVLNCEEPEEEDDE